MKFYTIVVLIMCSLTLSFAAIAQNKNISGQVKSESGESLTGATVTLRNQSNKYSTLTNAQGEFTLSNLKDGAYDLSVSFIGYELYSQKINVPVAPLNVVLKEQINQMNEVVISTQKRTQNRIDVPIAVSALSGRTLDNMNIRQYDELAQYIPGLQMQLQSPNNPSYVIRGITSDEGDTRTQHRVSVFQDGVSMSRSRGSVSELFDMERVEVVKGPQGTLFGRGAQIGAVHFIQNKPTFDLSGELNLGYGNYNQKIANGFINTPFANDKLSNRLAFYYNERDGFIDNYAGGKLNGRNVVALRNILRYQPTQNTTADLIINYQKDNYPGTSFKNRQFAPPGGDTDPNSMAGLDKGKDLYIKRDVLGTSLLVNHTFSPAWSLTSTTAYRQYDSDESFDPDGTMAPILWISELAKGNQVSQEFRFNYENDKRFSGFLGASFFHENAETTLPLRVNEQSLYRAITPMIQQGISAQLVAAGIPAQQVSALVPVLFPAEPLLTNGVPNFTQQLPNIAGTLAALGLPVQALPASVQQLVGMLTNAPLNANHLETSYDYGRNTAYEIFADGTYKLTPNFWVTGGLRGSYERQMGGYKVDQSTTPSTVGLLMGNYPNILWRPTPGKISLEKDYFSWVGRLAVNYMLDDQRNNVYASVSRGRRPGVIMITPVDTTFLKPEIVVSYEAGYKGRSADRKFGYDFTTYFYDWSNFQSNSYELLNGNLVYISRDAGKAHSFGIETSLNYNLFGKSSVFVNGAYIDGKFNKKDENGNEQELAGNTFRLTSKYTFSAGLDLNFTYNQKNNFYIRPSYAWKSKLYFENTNREDLSQDAYGLAHLNIGTRIQAKGSKYYEISLFGKNILDTKYIIDAGNTGDAIGMPSFIGGTRATFGLQLKAGF